MTKSGQSELDRPIAIRPTSETVMYPYYAQVPLCTLGTLAFLSSHSYTGSWLTQQL